MTIEKKLQTLYFEIVCPIQSEYYTISDETTFGNFNFNDTAYVSRTSRDYYESDEIIEDITSMLKKEMERLISKFPEREFSIVFTPSTDGDESESIGVFTLFDDATETYVCHVEAFKGDFSDNDFTPSYHTSSTIH
jgi:hypothetical protein